MTAVPLISGLMQHGLMQPACCALHSFFGACSRSCSFSFFAVIERRAAAAVMADRDERVPCESLARPPRKGAVPCRAGRTCQGRLVRAAALAEDRVEHDLRRARAAVSLRFA